MEQWIIYPEGKPSAEARRLADQVEKDGGRVLSIFQDPLGGHWQLFAFLPLDRVEVMPCQRNLSPTHTKRLQEVIRKMDRFIDPIVVISPKPGVYWTPNGNHRRVALEKLKGKMIPAVLAAEPEVGHWILALNTERAPNLRDKSLAVIRLHRTLAQEHPRDTEEDYAFQFESPHFITLGLLYEENGRFAGGAFAPILRRVDRFLKGTLPAALRQREERAEMVREADKVLAGVVARLKKRGINHPYVKPFVLSRTTPLTRARKTLPSFEVAFRRLKQNLEEFDVAKIRYEDVARTALFAAPEEPK